MNAKRTQSGHSNGRNPVDLTVRLGSLDLRNPVLVASGTFGYAKEMAASVDFRNLGAIIPKTVTKAPRPGNPPPRTVETASGMLNAIGLDNDGIDHFISHHVPYLSTLPVPVIANVAGKTVAEFEELAASLASCPGLAGLELNLSCPNVSGGVDFAVDPAITAEVVRRVRRVWVKPLIAKLTPNVTSIVPMAAAAAEAGADAVSVANTLLGIAIDWRRRRPILGNVTGGLSGPAIKPIILRMVWQIHRAVRIPLIGVGGIQSIDDVMEYLVAGASAVQVGTANFYAPQRAEELARQLPVALAHLDAQSVRDVVGTLAGPPNGPPTPPPPTLSAAGARATREGAASIDQAAP